MAKQEALKGLRPADTGQHHRGCIDEFDHEVAATSQPISEGSPPMHFDHPFQSNLIHAAPQNSLGDYQPISGQRDHRRSPCEVATEKPGHRHQDREASCGKSERGATEHHFGQNQPRTGAPQSDHHGRKHQRGSRRPHFDEDLLAGNEVSTRQSHCAGAYRSGRRELGVAYPPSSPPGNLRSIRSPPTLPRLGMARQSRPRHPAGRRPGGGRPRVGTSRIC